MVCGLQCPAAPPAFQLLRFDHSLKQGASVILKNTLSVRCCVPLLLFASGLSAAPRLNLIQTSLTIAVPTGTNGPTQTIDAFNIGDGKLNLQAASNVTWLAPTIGATQVCGLRGACYPIQIALKTSSLTAGTSTGTITLSDPNALDAPQYINVTAQVGGNVPDKIVFYLAPGASASSTFTTNGTIKTQTSGTTPWLKAATAVNTSTGSYVTTVTATAGSSMAASDYNGTLIVSGSSFAADNKQISVLLHVTTQPIAQASSNTLSLNIAQGSKPQTIPVAVTNAGQGALTVSSVTATAANSGTWLSAATVTGGFNITVDPTGLSPNLYTGTVTIASNAANGDVVIPVQLTIVPQGPPIASAGGVVNNGTFASGESLSQGDIVAVFGNQFTFDDPQSAQSLPLQTTMGGVQVLVNGKAAPIYFVSATQINFEVPIDAATGDGNVQVVRNGQQGNLIYANIGARIPRFILLSGGPYAIMTTPEGDLTGIPTHPVKVGDTIVIYALGLGSTTPVVDSGTASPASPLAEVPGTTQVCFGIETPFFQAPCATAFFSGLTPNFVGLYQINVTIPSGIESGNGTMSLLLVDNIQSNSVQLAVQ
jgi:uncharacterized protein (TIGR03437 family)